MLINLKCDTCKEPSKYVTGFYDGKKANTVFSMIAKMNYAKLIS